ncbi:MAG: iron-containing redox enzyme family protein [Deltaproteobacteria bacterium]|nr:iron-containing redox enzyme family protein [Deltaproteobacteria bacterium]
MPTNSTTWLDRLTPAVRERLAACGNPVAFESGHALIVRDGIESHLYLVEAGRLRVHVPGGFSTELGAGELVGEMAFLDSAPRRFDVTVLEAARLRHIERRDLLAAFVDAPLLLTELLQAIADVSESRRAALAATLETPADFVARLASEALRHRAVQHPYLQALAEGTLPDTRWALADFARHYYAYSSHFPRYLTTVISRLERPEHRRALLENLTEESGVYEQEELATLAELGVERDWIEGLPHPVLFRRFSEAIGVSHDTPNESDQVVAWRDLFLQVLGNSAAEGLGALGLGTENIVRTIYGPFVKAIARLDDLALRDTVFFPLHTAVDDHHQATLQSLSVDHADTPEGRLALRRGMLKALQLRSAFWDWMLARAMNPADSAQVI